MKIFKFIASFLLFLGILVLMFWAATKANDQNCTGISIVIHSPEENILLSESDILNILEQNHTNWEGKIVKDIDLNSVHKILAQEHYIKSVDKIHFLGSKLQIEVTLYDILLAVEPNNGQKFLIDVQGVYLPYSPKVKNDILLATGILSDTYQKNETVNQGSYSLYELFCIASLINEDPFYSKLFRKLYINEKQEIVLYPTIGDLSVQFGTMQNAENKLKILKYMYDEVLPYMEDNKYAQLDIRFKNRIIATKSKT